MRNQAGLGGGTDASVGQHCTLMGVSESGHAHAAISLFIVIFLMVVLCLASGQAKLARQRHRRFFHADPTRQQAVRCVQPLGLLCIG